MRKLRACLAKIQVLRNIVNTFRDINEFLQCMMIQIRYKKILSNKRALIKKEVKIKVAFFVTQKQLWPSHSVYKAFENSDLFDVFIVTFPNCEDKINSLGCTEEENFTYFKSQGLKVFHGFNQLKNKFAKRENFSFDIVFYDQPFPQLPIEFSFKTLCKDALICYIPYGFKIANAYKGHFNMPLQNCSWKVFAESGWHQLQFKKY